MIRARKTTSLSGKPGFTLVELLVVLAIMALLMVVAAPGWRKAMNRSRIKGAVQQMVSLLNMCRNTASAERRTVVIEKDEEGCFIGVLKNDDSEGRDRVVGKRFCPPTGVFVGLDPDGPIVFYPSGEAEDKMVITIKTNGKKALSKAITVSSLSGKVSVSAGNEM